ncbi:MAG: hypothetical protein ACRDY3_08615, partial [Acidimicrobiales bacterium]
APGSAPGSAPGAAPGSAPGAAPGSAPARSDPGLVLVQTRLPRHPVLAAAVAGDPALLTELAVRRQLSLPPFSALAAVVSDDRPPLEGVETSCVGDGRWLVRAPDHRRLCDALSALRGGVTVDPRDV